MRAAAAGSGTRMTSDRYKFLMHFSQYNSNGSTGGGSGGDDHKFTRSALYVYNIARMCMTPVRAGFPAKIKIRQVSAMLR